MTTQLTMDLDATAAKTTTAAAPNAGAVKAHHNRHNRRTAVAAIRERAAAKAAKVAPKAAKVAPKADKTAKVAKVAKTAAPHEDILAILNRHAAEVAAYKPCTADTVTTPAGVVLDRNRITEYITMRNRQKAEVVQYIKKDAQGAFEAVLRVAGNSTEVALMMLGINFYEKDGKLVVSLFTALTHIGRAWNEAVEVVKAEMEAR